MVGCQEEYVPLEWDVYIAAGESYCGQVAQVYPTTQVAQVRALLLGANLGYPSLQAGKNPPRLSPCRMASSVFSNPHSLTL